MELKQAYEMVVDDIFNSPLGVLKGHYDAKNGSKKYMHGVLFVLEYLVRHIDDEDKAEIFLDKFISNMIESEGNIRNE